MGFSHSTGCSRNRKGTGDFHRPYETQKFLHFTIQPARCGTKLISAEEDAVVVQALVAEGGQELFLGDGGSALAGEL